MAFGMLHITRRDDLNRMLSSPGENSSAVWFVAHGGIDPNRSDGESTRA